MMAFSLPPARALLPIAAFAAAVPGASTACAGGWVVVLQPMLACEAPQDDPALQQRLLAALPRWEATKGIEPPCGQLAIGDKFALDHQQTEADTHIVVKMWRPVCPRGCSPSMTPVYAPPRVAVGAYMTPTTPPPGWR